jgi:hypothetical protein
MVLIPPNLFGLGSCVSGGPCSANQLFGHLAIAKADFLAITSSRVERILKTSDLHRHGIVHLGE